MASTIETGHAKNVANFDDLISFATGYGTAFNPSKPSIKLTAYKPFQQVLKMQLMQLTLHFLHTATQLQPVKQRLNL